MRSKLSNLLKPALLIGAVMCCFSCQKYKPELKYPVVFVKISEQKEARWSEPVKTIIFKDANGELQELYTQRGYYDRWTDSIYHNCEIGDTIK